MFPSRPPRPRQPFGGARSGTDTAVHTAASILPGNARVGAFELYFISTRSRNRFKPKGSTNVTVRDEFSLWGHERPSQIQEAPECDARKLRLEGIQLESEHACLSRRWLLQNRHFTHWPGPGETAQACETPVYTTCIGWNFPHHRL
jgi:hypothetical protein